jgi:hypothetical protein
VIWTAVTWMAAALIAAIWCPPACEGRCAARANSAGLLHSALFHLALFHL